MKKISYFKAFFVVTAIFLSLFLTACSSQEESSSDSAQEVQVEGSADEKISNEIEKEVVSVTTYKTSSSEAFYLSFLGTVQADTHVYVFPGTMGQVTAVNVEEGDIANKGDILFVLGGSNGAEHSNVTQYRVAHANYTAANEAYGNVVSSSNAAVKMSELQLQSAKNQSEGAYIDYYSFANSIEASRDSVGLIRNSFEETKIQNERNLQNILDGIDDLEDERREAVLDLEEQIDNSFDDDVRMALKAQLKTAKNSFDDQIEALEDQYDSIKSGAILAENQILGQLQQAENQQKSLYMTRDSTVKKLGLTNGTSDPVLFAEQGVVSAEAQSNIAITQAKSQRNLAKISLDSAYELQKQLLVQAPTSGTIGNVMVSEGDSVSSQAFLAEIIGDGGFVIKVGVDIANADKIDLTKNAEILIGGRYIKMPIKHISPVADQISRLVTVTVELPKINFRPNQTLNVKLPVRSSNGSSQSGTALLIPLDSVIIGTEEQFVYVNHNGKAKKVIVILGEINGGLIEILDGLDSNDDVIVDGVRDLTAGQPVIIK